MKLEDAVSQSIQLEAPKHKVTLLRNNSGAMTDINGRLVRYGLGNTSQQINAVFKSSDLIGITPIVITPDMVGQTIGVFTAVECKKEGWNPKQFNAREKAQQSFISFVRCRGGFAGFAACIEDFRKIVKK